MPAKRSILPVRANDNPAHGAPLDGAAGGRFELVVDPLLGHVLQASQAARTLLGLADIEHQDSDTGTLGSSTNASHPVCLDTAMPAMRTLGGCIGLGAQVRDDVRLVFWTPAGPVVERCSVREGDISGTVHVSGAVSSDRSASDRASPAQQPDPISGTAGALRPSRALSVPDGRKTSAHVKRPRDAVRISSRLPKPGPQDQEAMAELKRQLGLRGLDLDTRAAGPARTGGLQASSLSATPRIAPDEVAGSTAEDVGRKTNVKPGEPALQPDEAAVLARVSHEVRTPLSSIIGFAEMMRDERLGPIGNEKYRGYAADIHASAVYALSLVNDLLDFAQLQRGAGALEIAPFDLQALLHEATAAMLPQAEEKNIALIVHCAPSAARMAGDRRSVKQILLNLISNATRHSPAGEDVVLSARRMPGKDGEVVRLRVRDNGPGMSEEEITAVMQPFGAPRRQVSSGRRVGSGLGLPICQMLADAHGGAFRILARSGGGLQVEVDFPQSE